MNIKKFSKPFKTILIENFLDIKDAMKIFSELKKEKFELKESDLFKFKQTKDLQFSKNKILRNFYSFLEKDFQKNAETFFGKKLSGKIDFAGTLYEKTDYLLPHDDRLESRKIAYIYYLSSLGKNDGGELVFYSSKNNIPIKISKRNFPKFNSIILFEVSKKSFHSVSEILKNKKRYSITGWLH
ncbi:MAG: 2OG-Fe(II) oxygenase family protein [Nanoarchaeota archaeon]